MRYSPAFVMNNVPLYEHMTRLCSYPMVLLQYLSHPQFSLSTLATRMFPFHRCDNYGITLKKLLLNCQPTFFAIIWRWAVEYLYLLKKKTCSASALGLV